MLSRAGVSLGLCKVLEEAAVAEGTTRLLVAGAK